MVTLTVLILSTNFIKRCDASTCCMKAGVVFAISLLEPLSRLSVDQPVDSEVAYVLSWLSVESRNLFGVSANADEYS
jgi:hypothetical protein